MSAYIHDVNVAVKDVLVDVNSGRRDEIRGVVFKIDQSKGYHFRLQGDANGLAVGHLAIKQHGIGPIADFVTQFVVTPTQPSHDINQPRDDEWFIYGGIYVNYNVERYGNNVEVFFRASRGLVKKCVNEQLGGVPFSSR